MRKIMLLKGQNNVDATSYLSANAVTDPWLVLMNPDLSLHEYLTTLHEDYGLNNSVLSRMKICRYLTWEKGSVSFKQLQIKQRFPADIVELLKLLRESGHPEVIIENDDKILFAELVQQLIYLNFPLKRVYVGLRSERQDRGYVRQLFADAAMHAVNVQICLESLPQCPDAASLHESMEICRALLSGKFHGPLKLAIAASKKSGKSTLLNCILGLDIAPNSAEIATPNTCEYINSEGQQFRLYINEENVQVFDSAAMLKEKIESEFLKAQRNKNAGFSMLDMKVEYPGKNRLPNGWNLLDTPGPDTAGTYHRKSAEQAMLECDAAIFIIDYSKYLTENEYSYLEWIKSIFAQKGHFSNLAFVLNKMDLAIQDKGAKSWVKSIDFIRCRLKSLDPNYAECIIFPISALNYANLLTLQDAADKEPLIAKLLDNDTRWNKNIGWEIDDLEDLDEVVITALARLLGEVSHIKHIMGLKDPTTEEIKNLSGFNQFLDYTVARIEANNDWACMKRSAFLCGQEIKKINTIIDNANNDLKSRFQGICSQFMKQWHKIEQIFVQL